MQVLNLTCDGGGTPARSDAALAYGAPSYGRREVHRGFDGRLELRLLSADDGVALPSVMLSGARAGDSQWFRIKKVVANDRQITGRISTGATDFLKPPRFSIDRKSGAIEIVTRTGAFSGVCKKADAQASEF